MTTMLFQKKQWNIYVTYDAPISPFSSVQLYINVGTMREQIVDDFATYIIGTLKTSLESLSDSNVVRKDLKGEHTSVSLGELYNRHSFMLGHRDESDTSVVENPTRGYSIFGCLFSYRKNGRFFLEISSLYPDAYNESVSLADFEQWLKTDYQSHVLELTESEIVTFKEHIDRLYKELEKNSEQSMKGQTP